jgi:hypothetical protein
MPYNALTFRVRHVYIKRLVNPFIYKILKTAPDKRDSGTFRPTPHSKR